MERFTLDIFHYEKGQRAFDHTIIGNANHILMSYRCGGESFLSKTRDKLRIVSNEIRQNDFDGKLCFKISMAGLVNDAHSALAEAAFDMIFTFENRFARNSVNGRHPIMRTGQYTIGEAILTKLAFLH